MAGGITAELARFIAGTRPSDLPEDVRAAEALVIADAFACALAGSGLEVGALATTASHALFGEGTATLLGSGERTSPARAAFVNGSHVHGLNYDANGPTGGHVGLVSLAPLLAVAEASSTAVSGEDLILSGVLAAEIADRLVLAARHGGAMIRGRRDGGWLLGQVIGYLAAAGGAARLRGLGEAETRSALGLALMQCAGTKQVMIEGDAPAKGLYGGFACLGGVLATLLAAGGVEADVRALEGPAGLMGVFFDAGEEALEVAFASLGEHWAVSSAEIKRWPASGVVQPYIEAALALRATIAAAGGSIVGVKLRGLARERDWFEPTAARLAPTSAAAAGNSVPFGVACALVHGTLDVEHLVTPRFGGERVADLLSRTTHHLEGEPTVTVLLADSTSVSSVLDRDSARERREDPAELVRWKLASANRHATVPLSPEALGAIYMAVEHLERVEDVRGLFVAGRAAPR